MTYVVCIVPVAPLRAEGNHRSEMVSQLLFGEFAEVVEVMKDFLLIRTIQDEYAGWVQSSQLTEVEDAVLQTPLKGYSFQSGVHISFNGSPMHVSIATPVYKTADKGFGVYAIGWQVDAKRYEFTENNIVELSRKYLNVSYLWGGRSSFGIDCSGFVQQVYKMMGVNLPRDAYQQAMVGENVGFLQEVKCGDLAFFDNEEGKITHVGILLNQQEIIHASGKVRIDKVDSLGIFNVESNQRSHKLRIIKRVAGF